MVTGDAPRLVLMLSPGALPFSAEMSVVFAGMPWSELWDTSWCGSEGLLLARSGAGGPPPAGSAPAQLCHAADLLSHGHRSSRSSHSLAPTLGSPCSSNCWHQLHPLLCQPEAQGDPKPSTLLFQYFCGPWVGPGMSCFSKYKYWMPS